MPEPASDLARFAEAIRFVHWQPDERPRGLVGWIDRWRPGKLNLDFRNTRLPHGTDAERRLRVLKGTPRMSTMAIGAIINEAVARMPPGQAYVNVGVWNGFTFLAGCLGNADKRCIGVDNFSQYGGPRAAFLRRFTALRGPLHEFHDVDYQEYFERVHNGPIGVYYYDGEHSYENQLRGLEVAERFFAPSCVVVVDDTNGEAARRATTDFTAARPGQYEVILDRTTSLNGHPTWWNGLMVLRRR